LILSSINAILIKLFNTDSTLVILEIYLRRRVLSNSTAGHHCWLAELLVVAGAVPRSSCAVYGGNRG
jgi:hypothetical protein